MLSGIVNYRRDNQVERGDIHVHYFKSSHVERSVQNIRAWRVSYPDIPSTFFVPRKFCEFVTFRQKEVSEAQVHFAGHSDVGKITRSQRGKTESSAHFVIHGCFQSRPNRRTSKNSSAVENTGSTIRIKSNR